MGSLQPRNQVVDRRAEPDEERVADFNVVTDGRDSSDVFIVSLDDRIEEITEQWQDGLHDCYICRDDQCTVEPARISRGVSQKRGYFRFCSCLKRRFVSACTNSQISTPRENDSHKTTRDVGVCLVPTLFPCNSLAWVSGTTQYGLIEQDPHSINFRSCSEWFKRGGQNRNNDEDDVLVLADGWNNVFLDRVVHAPNGADACSINSSFVDTCHVDPWNVTMWSNVFREGFGETVLTWYSLVAR